MEPWTPDPNAPQVRHGVDTSRLDDATFLSPDIAAEERWQPLGRQLRDEFGVGSMLAYRLRLLDENDALAALNLASDRADAFSAGDATRPRWRGRSSAPTGPRLRDGPGTGPAVIRPRPVAVLGSPVSAVVAGVPATQLRQDVFLATGEADELGVDADLLARTRLCRPEGVHPLLDLGELPDEHSRRQFGGGSHGDLLVLDIRWGRPALLETDPIVRSRAVLSRPRRRRATREVSKVHRSKRTSTSASRTPVTRRQRP